MALTILDSSVVIAFLNGSDAHHAAARAALEARREHDLAAPATVYAEALVGPLRIGIEAARLVDGFFRDLPIRIEPVGTEIARRAAELRAAVRALVLPDAIVLATGELVGAEVLTADRSLARAGADVPVAVVSG